MVCVQQICPEFLIEASQFSTVSSVLSLQGLAVLPGNK